MKKTFITLLALTGVAMGSTTFEVSLPSAIPVHKEKSGSENWTDLARGEDITTALYTDLSNLKLTSQTGDYYFYKTGVAENASLKSVEYDTTNHVMKLIGRAQGARQDVYYTNICTVGSILGDKAELADVTSITLKATIALDGNAKGAFGLYAWSEGDSTLTNLSGLEATDNAFGGWTTATTRSITLTGEQIASLSEDTKLFAVIRNDYLGAWSQMTVSGLNYTVKAVPEPATATLSLLALAGLAMRRRRK